MFNGEKIELKPGQLVTGRNNLSAETGEHPSRIYRALKYLESEHQIEQLKTPRYTLITVKNWHRYQGSEQANGQPKPKNRTGKNKKPNTIKNNNNKYIGVSITGNSKRQKMGKDTGGKKNMEEKGKTGMEGKDEEEKKKYLEFVLLADREYQDLVKKLGEEKTKKMIEKLNNYIGSRGKYYDSHYYTILLWMLDEKEENQDEGPGYEKYKKS